MEIKCKSCGHKEETSLRFFIRIIGGALPAGGYWAWVSYFFAGTGFAMPICIAMIAGGAALLMFQNEIVKWLCEKGYKCSKCSNSNWEATGK